MIKKQQKSSCPEGYLAAGINIPLELTKRQQRYARRAAGISRLCYNTAVATLRMCLANHLRYPSGKNDGKSYYPGANDIAKTFNAVKHEHYPFVTEVSKFVAQDAFRDFGNALQLWWNPDIKSGPPQFKKKKRTGAGRFRHRHHTLRRTPAHPTALPGQRKDGTFPARRLDPLRSTYYPAQRPDAGRHRLLAPAD